MHGPRIATLCALLVLPAGVWASGRGREKQAPVSCSADVAAAITQLCPCDGFPTHGQYMRCLVHLASALRRARCPGHVSRAALRCAAWSTCGKQTAVVCCTSTPGACSEKPGQSDAGCTTFRARLSRDAATCTATGGTPMGTGSVCTVCAASNTTATTTTSTSTTSSTTTTTSTTSTSTTTLPAGVNYGSDVEFPTVATPSAGFLMGGPVTVPLSSTLTHLCVITKAGGPHVVLALYSDLGGEPHGLLASSPPTPMALGRMEIPVTLTPLAAGTYWIMALYDADASIGIDSADASVPVRDVAQSFSSPLPDPFPPASPFSGVRFNYYLKVE